MRRNSTRIHRGVKPEQKTAKIADPTASLYYLEVGRYPLPTKAKERKLFAAYAEAKTLSENARSSKERAESKLACQKIGQEIACGYLRFVIQQAGRKTSDPSLLKDLIGQGNIGLMIGIDRFSLEFGTRFLTYAASWIRVYMQDYLHKLGVVHVPSHTRKEIRKKRPAGAAPADTEEPTTLDLDDVAVANSSDVGAEVSRREYGSLRVLDTPGLTRPEKLVLLYGFGMRGVEMSNAQLAMMLYELGVGFYTAKSLNSVKTEALLKLRAAFAQKGVNSLDAIL